MDVCVGGGGVRDYVLGWECMWDCVLVVIKIMCMNMNLLLSLA